MYLCRIHRDGSEFQSHNHDSDQHRDMKVGDEEGQRMADAAHCRHEPANHPPNDRTSAPTEHTVVGKCFGKTHANTGADGSRHADQEGIPTVPRGKGRREDGSQRRDRSIHEPRKTRLNDLKNKHPPVGLILCLPRPGLFQFPVEFAREVFMDLLSNSQFIEQLAHGEIGRSLGGGLVKTHRLQLPSTQPPFAPAERSALWRAKEVSGEGTP